MKNLIFICILSVSINSCSLYKLSLFQKELSIYHSNKTFGKNDCNDLKEYQYNGFYKPSQKGKTFEIKTHNYYDKLTFEDQPIIALSEMTSIEKSFGPTGLETITVTLNKQATEKFKQYTATHKKTKLGIIFMDKLISAPMIQSEIPKGHIQISTDLNDPVLLQYLQTFLKCNKK